MPVGGDAAGRPPRCAGVCARRHLYERFLKIMMQSVVEKSSRRVKFWLLKNFPSPAFMGFLPQMASAVGFDYALVQYQWPSWLHKQTNKQRIIWGYKILFLDVMFPLHLKKIVYIDADQVEDEPRGVNRKGAAAE